MLKYFDHLTNYFLKFKSGFSFKIFIKAVDSYQN